MNPICETLIDAAAVIILFAGALAHGNILGVLSVAGFIRIVVRVSLYR